MASRTTSKKISKEKFTIVLTNYNSEEYIEESLISIFNQTYKNIELIITDDSSKKFSKELVEKIIKKHSPNNIKEVKYLINKQNLGTVKTLNKALELVTGDYILFFASDDKLASNNIIEEYVNTFKSKKVNIITSNWILCDENLNVLKKFKKPRFLNKFNKKKVIKQYAQLCITNIYGAGSTCYRSDIFKKYGNFDENFKYLEDWPLWLKLTYNNEKIYYINLDGLLHRSGGISHDKKVNEVKIEFFKEILNLYKNYILKNIDHLSNTSKIKIINSYLFSIKFYSKYFDTSEYFENIIDFINKNKKFKFSMFLYKICPKYFHKLDILLRLNKSVPITFILTILTMFIIINLNVINSKFLLLPITILLYVIIYYFTCTFLTILLAKRGK